MTRNRYARMGRGFAIGQKERAAPSDGPARPDPEPDAASRMTLEQAAASLAQDEEFGSLVRAELRARWAR